MEELCNYINKTTFGLLPLDRTGARCASSATFYVYCPVDLHLGGVFVTTTLLRYLDIHNPHLYSSFCSFSRLNRNAIAILDSSDKRKEHLPLQLSMRNIPLITLETWSFWTYLDRSQISGYWLELRNPEVLKLWKN